MFLAKFQGLWKLFTSPGLAHVDPLPTDLDLKYGRFSSQFTDKNIGTQGVDKAAKGSGKWEQAGRSPGFLTADTGLWKEGLDGLMLGKGKPLRQL